MPAQNSDDNAVTGQILAASASGSHARGSKSICMRFFWLFIVLGSLATFSYHLSTLVTRFLLESVSIEEAPTGKPFVFPDVHLCPQIPFSDSIIRELAARNDSRWVEFNTNLRRIESTIDRYNDTITGVDALRLKVRALWETMDLGWLQRTFSQKSYEGILLFKVNGVDLNYTKFKVTPNWEYFFCQTYTPDENVSSINLMMFTDSSNVIHQKPHITTFAGQPIKSISFTGDPDVTKSGGIVIYLTPRGSYPSTDDGAAKIVSGTGSETSINLKQAHYQALSTGKRPCLSAQSDVDFVNFLQPIENSTYKYSRWTCVGQWTSELIYNKCGCLFHAYPTLPSLNKTSGKYPPFCFDLRRVWNGELSDAAFLELRTCVQKALDDIQDKLESNATCRTTKSLCDNQKYVAETFSVMWPVSTLGDAIGNVYVSPRIANITKMNNTAPGLNDVYTAFQYAFMTNPTVHAVSLTMLIGRENFLTIQIRRDAYQSSVSTESLSYPISNLFSDLGGILGMYLGISILSVVELIEALLEMFRMATAARVQVRAESERKKQRNTISFGRVESATTQRTIVENIDNFVKSVEKDLGY